MTQLEETQQDARALARRRYPRARSLPWFATGLSLPLLSLGFVMHDAGYQNALRFDQTLSEIKPVFTLPLLFNSSDLVAAGSFGAPDVTADGSRAVNLNVRGGDTLDRLFRREGLDLNQLAEVMKLAPARENLRLLKPGDQIHVRHDAGNILEMTRKIDAFNTLSVIRDAGGFDAKVVALDYETRSARATGQITSSLFEAAAQAGVSDATIMKLASIFASDIDFVLDLRDGDQFTLVYEQMWRDGSKLADGEILAAEFVNQGQTHRAIRYKARDGRVNYYTPEGKSLRKAFIRAPLAFSRVSSDFNPHRLHPILNTIRAHTGVDYAAPTGTPVHAPGDGKIVFRGRKGGYGNAVILDHGGGITTLYGHLSGFAKTFHEGSRVSQGDIIAYVGATGLATAPHLHYEYRINGIYMNPRTVKLPDAKPIDATEREQFLQAASTLVRRLNGGGTMFATGTTAHPG